VTATDSARTAAAVTDDDRPGFEGAVLEARPGQVESGSRLHNQVLDFLIAEARLLDHNHYTRWLGLLADDLRYRMPVRRTVRRREGLGYDPTMTHFDDDHASMSLRIRRLAGDNAWSEDPPSRTRRFVSNVQVFTTDAPDEVEVESYLLLTRSAKDDTHFDLVPAERHDLLRRAPVGFTIARRTIYIDQTRVGTPNFAIFL